MWSQVGCRLLESPRNLVQMILPGPFMAVTDGEPLGEPDIGVDSPLGSLKFETPAHPLLRAGPLRTSHSGREWRDSSGAGGA